MNLRCLTLVGCWHGNNLVQMILHHLSGIAQCFFVFGTILSSIVLLRVDDRCLEKKKFVLHVMFSG